MLAAVYYNNKDVRVQEVPKPEIGDDEVLVKVMQNGGSLGAWRKVTKDLNYSIEESQIFQPTLEEPLPWDFIDTKIDKKKLLNLYHQVHG